MNNSCRLQSRGPVQEAALYIARTVDPGVEAAMRSGRLCLILGPPGSGKSSLRLRVGRALSATGVPGAQLPLGKLPSATPAAFCLGLMQGLSRALNLPPLSGFFQRYAAAHGETPPAERLQAFFAEMVPGTDGQGGPVALFFDDLDALDGACAEALCTALYGLYTNHAAAAEGDGKAPLLLGVCLTSTKDMDALSLPLPATALRIYLPPFSRTELDAFAPALLSVIGEEAEEDKAAAMATLLDTVYAFTGGHPYLTQYLGQKLVARSGQLAAAAKKEAPQEGAPPETLAARIERHIEQLFPAGGVGDDPVLLMMERRLTTDRRAQALLALWRRLWRGEAVPTDPNDAVQRALYLAGLSTCPESPDGKEGARLQPLGRLFMRVFDDEWARAEEARQLLRLAAAEGDAAKLRGAALKTAETWALRHPEAVSGAELRALIMCLEAAHKEAEARHQSSAAALQRETRERSELRAQWNREREELVARAQRAERRVQALAVLVALLAALGLFAAYLAFKR